MWVWVWVLVLVILWPAVGLKGLGGTLKTSRKCVFILWFCGNLKLGARHPKNLKVGTYALSPGTLACGPSWVLARGEAASSSEALL